MDQGITMPDSQTFTPYGVNDSRYSHVYLIKLYTLWGKQILGIRTSGLFSLTP